MIKEDDLREAIAECLGKRNPDAQTCIKLAAFYTILEQLYPTQMEYVPSMEQNGIKGHSFALESGVVDYVGESEFARLCNGKPLSEIMPVLDELMDTIQAIQPRLYAGVIRRLTE